ncbi:MAG: D-sedoheptulose-7-phosphate isomerase [Acidimicrobiales bacterium]
MSIEIDEVGPIDLRQVADGQGEVLPPGGAGFAAAEVAKLQASLAELGTEAYTRALAEVAAAIVSCLREWGKVLFCGNGGSAADAQHLAAELVGRQNYDRPPAAGIALSVDTSVLTALSNDYGYDGVFARQVEALGRPGDVLVGISTSGRSRNVVQALQAARAGGVVTVAFTGREPRDMGAADFVLAMPAAETAKVQELQLVAGHIVFALVEQAMFPLPSADVPAPQARSRTELARGAAAVSG